MMLQDHKMKHAWYGKNNTASSLINKQEQLVLTCPIFFNFQEQFSSEQPKKVDSEWFYGQGKYAETVEQVCHGSGRETSDSLRRGRILR